MFDWHLKEETELGIKEVCVCVCVVNTLNVWVEVGGVGPSPGLRCI